jgi:DNA-binding transcriptional ArsR family regulator
VLDSLGLDLYLTNMLNAATVPDNLSTTLAALADPTRRAILARLARGEATVTEIAEPFAMSLPAVSRHLKVLARAGLISRSREAQWRPCKLEAEPLRDVSDWVEQYRQLWDERLDRLEAYLHELQHKEQKHARNKKK